MLALLEFLNLSLHYKSAQDLEFEDEDYLYQVRAIPKINPVSKQKTKIKKIHEPAEKVKDNDLKEEPRVKPLRQLKTKEESMAELFDK